MGMRRLDCVCTKGLFTSSGLEGEERDLGFRGVEYRYV